MLTTVVAVLVVCVVTLDCGRMNTLSERFLRSLSYFIDSSMSLVMCSWWLLM